MEGYHWRAMLLTLQTSKIDCEVMWQKCNSGITVNVVHVPTWLCNLEYLNQLSKCHQFNINPEFVPKYVFESFFKQATPFNMCLYVCLKWKYTVYNSSVYFCSCFVFISTAIHVSCMYVIIKAVLDKLWYHTPPPSGWYDLFIVCVILHFYEHIEYT